MQVIRSRETQWFRLALWLSFKTRHGVRLAFGADSRTYGHPRAAVQAICEVVPVAASGSSKMLSKH